MTRFGRQWQNAHGMSTPRVIEMNLQRPTQLHHSFFPRTSLCAWLLLVALNTGCARTHLFYDTQELRHTPMPVNHKLGVQRFLDEKLQGKTLTWVDARGHARTLDVPAGEFRKMPWAEQVALWLALNGGEPGGENDIRVRIRSSSGREDIPVTVEHDLEGNLVVRSSPRDVRVRADGAPTLKTLRTRFRLGRRLPGRWQSSERRALAEALEGLSPVELDVVRPLSIERHKAPRNGNRMQAALYQRKGCAAAIILYASGVASDRYRFVGSVKRPRNAALHSLVHEMGHAFEQELARRAFCRAKKSRGSRARGWHALGTRWTDKNPVLDAYLEVLSGAPAPTDYGNTSQRESFAESFALFHVDPDALKRARPEVYQWFDEGKHLAIFQEFAAKRPD